MPSPSQSSYDRHAYIPPHMQQAMAQHAQQSMPAHLKKYQNGSGPVPQHIERAIQQHMQKSVPAHMKQYVGAFVQQNVVSPSLSRPASVPIAMSHPAPHTLVPHLPRQDHFHNPETQQAPLPTSPESSFNSLSVASETIVPTAAVVPPSQTPAAPPPPGIPGPEQSYTTHPTYDFIMNPEQPAKQSPLTKLPGNSNPLIMRIGLMAGGLVILLFAFVFIKGLLSGGGNQTSLMSVAQSQQALIHLATGANLEKSLSLHNQNFAITAQLSLTSARGDLIAYLGKTGLKKVDPKVINLKVSATTDEELALAATAGTYDSTFQEIMKTGLSHYQANLQQAYGKTKGPAGRKLLSDQYKQSELLVEQLNNPAN